MIQEYLYITIFTSFPEALLMLLIGLNLSNVRDTKKSKFIIVAAIQAIVALMVRVLNIYLGIHTLIQIISLYILVIVFFKIKFYKAIIPVLIGMLVQVMLQSVIFTSINIVGGVELSKIYYTPKSAVLYSIPVFVVSLVFFIVIKRKNFCLFDIND